ncbi:MAG: phosphatase PAP2 family protein [Ferruginibacter sp.]
MINGLKLSILVLLFPMLSYAQEPVKADTLIKKLDSLQEKKNTEGIKPNNNIDPAAYTENTNLDFNTYFILLGSNIKQQFTTPFHTTKKNWIKVAAFAAGTAALTFADKPINKFTTRIATRSTSVRSTSHFITQFGGLYEAYTLGTLGAYGFIFKNQKVKTTTLLATQAYITASIMETVFKFLSGRQRPNYFADNVYQNQPTFKGPFAPTIRDINGKKLNSSFPSGHATVAFAAATVFAKEYKDKPFIPILAYSAASLIAVSRTIENKHWFTDILVGGMLGYLTGNQIVNNYHRYARIKSGKYKTSSVSLNLDYSLGKLQPGLVWKF